MHGERGKAGAEAKLKVDAQTASCRIHESCLLHALPGRQPATRRAVAQMYDKLLGKARGEYDETKIKDGVFGAMMQVSLTNDGPVTLQLDSQHPKPA